MRDAVSKLGSDPNKINPLVSTQSNAIHNFWRFVFFFLLPFLVLMHLILEYAINLYGRHILNSQYEHYLLC